jgi:hypothetical protein
VTEPVRRHITVECSVELDPALDHRIAEKICDDIEREFHKKLPIIAQRRFLEARLRLVLKEESQCNDEFLKRMEQGE